MLERRICAGEYRVIPLGAVSRASEAGALGKALRCASAGDRLSGTDTANDASIAQAALIALVATIATVVLKLSIRMRCAGAVARRASSRGGSFESWAMLPRGTSLP